jgi:hypothetical protein
LSDQPGLIAAEDQLRVAFRAQGFAVPANFTVPLEVLDAIRSVATSGDGRLVLAAGETEARELRSSVPALAALVELCTPEANALTTRSDMRCTFDEVILARPGGHDATSWHQDDAFSSVRRWGLIPPQRSLSLTFWIPLQDVSEASGALRYLPGSHRLDLRKHQREASGRFFIAEVDGSASQTVALDAGQCVVHHGRVVHRANPNLTSEPRWAVGIQFRPGRRAPLARPKLLPGEPFDPYPDLT